MRGRGAFFRFWSKLLPTSYQCSRKHFALPASRRCLVWFLTFMHGGVLVRRTGNEYVYDEQVVNETVGAKGVWRQKGSGKYANNLVLFDGVMARDD